MSNFYEDRRITLDVNELLQLMRTCSIAQIRAQLDNLRRYAPEKYNDIAAFYTAAAKQKP